MYRIVAIAVLIIFSGINITLFSLKDDNMKISIKTDSTELKINAEIADTNEEQRLGLMHREKLEDGKGMLFIYQEPKLLSYWMKDVLIPLDILYIGEDLQINHIVKSAPPCDKGDKCPTYSYLKPTKYVLELPGGYTEKHNIKQGDSIELDQ